MGMAEFFSSGYTGNTWWFGIPDVVWVAIFTLTVSLITVGLTNRNHRLVQERRLEHESIEARNLRQHERKEAADLREHETKQARDGRCHESAKAEEQRLYNVREARYLDMVVEINRLNELIGSMSAVELERAANSESYRGFLDTIHKAILVASQETAKRLDHLLNFVMDMYVHALTHRLKITAAEESLDVETANRLRDEYQWKNLDYVRALAPIIADAQIGVRRDLGIQTDARAYTRMVEKRTEVASEAAEEALAAIQNIDRHEGGCNPSL